MLVDALPVRLRTRVRFPPPPFSLQTDHFPVRVELENVYEARELDRLRDEWR